ncbi:MAG: DnaJ domain-containing protein [Leptolyngbyaceae cyanobacterium SM1_1_3]|nr:DnaJ domain-containing protein [Leptolyngbyaceae cyanobacterium SM1_1_3]NJN03970.1 DnaJ domain-containing protein [Leptolyngbyaceae cyanobacterium RM1_1_2]NJO09076.1 DnaJ domain-containing protein [Leptolyngbyaceae cyanobacterium SL_1_1]
MSEPNPPTANFYDLLKLKPGASVQEIRQHYRDLSKLYHPDTTALPPAIAKAKFQELNEAYATLSSPERRLTYDYKIGYSRLRVMQAPADLNHPVSRDRPYKSASAYLDPSDRPLSAGEIFALFILGLTFAACLVLVITIGLAKGEIAFGPLVPPDLASEEAISLETAELKNPNADSQFSASPQFQTVPQAVPTPPAVEATTRPRVNPADVH